MKSAAEIAAGHLWSLDDMAQKTGLHKETIRKLAKKRVLGESFPDGIHKTKYFFTPLDLERLKLRQALPKYSRNTP